jgi:predicted Zn-dependent peptidase
LDFLRDVASDIRFDPADNAWWLDRLDNAYFFGDDFAAANDLDARVACATSERVRATAQRMFDPKNYELFVLKPAAPSAVTLPPPNQNVVRDPP